MLLDYNYGGQEDSGELLQARQGLQREDEGGDAGGGEHAEELLQGVQEARGGRSVDREYICLTKREKMGLVLSA